MNRLDDCREKRICQVCKQELQEGDEWRKELPDTSMLPWSPRGWDGTNICSIKCQENAIRMNACWYFKNALKNMQQMPFSNFNELFGFGEEGGYAERKYEQMRCNPYHFILGLDVDNFLAVVIKK